MLGFVSASCTELQESIIDENTKIEQHVDVTAYGLVTFFPGIGVNVRTQRGSNGVEFNVAKDTSSTGFFYASAAYVRSLNGKKSGPYCGLGPGIVIAGHETVPTLTGFIGLKASGGINAFIDIGLMTLIVPNYYIPLTLPVVRGGIGISF